MKTVGIICEYNPLHLGHKSQFDTIRRQLGPDTAIVCLMSGNFVQRGAPAVIDASLRAKAAVLCGADLVLELPTRYALSSAEGFAAGGVGILAPFCDFLCFGSETGDRDTLLHAAELLCSPLLPPLLRSKLETGLSFPAARQAALEEMGVDSSVLTRPNDILALEYCKAMLRQGCRMAPMPILRPGCYHDTTPDPGAPSATALRRQMEAGEPWLDFVPAEAAAVFRAAPLHTLAAGERAVLARLRTMTEAEFEALPYGSEGLWRKFMHACRKYATLEEILTATKSKRYTRSRLDRMLMCAFLGLTREDMESPAPYTRVLAFNSTGRTVLNSARAHGLFLNAGARTDHPEWAAECRRGDLYGLFRTDGPDRPGAEEARRVYCHKE